MTETKPWYQSLGMWAGIVTLAASILRLFRVEVDDATQQDLAEWLLSAATLAGGAAAVWGRWRATRRIAPASPPTDPGARTGFIGAAFWPLGAALALCVAAGAVGGCQSLWPVQSPGGAYVAADQATYDAVAPSFSQYVDADPALSLEEKGRRQRTIQTWKSRIDAAEAGSSK